MTVILINSISSYLDTEHALEIRAYAVNNYVDAENNLTIGCKPGGNAYYHQELRGGTVELSVSGGVEYFIGLYDKENNNLEFMLFESVFVPIEETVRYKSLTLQ